MQSAFVEVGLERDAFLYVTDFVEGIEEDHDEEEIVVSKGSGQQREQQQQDGGFRERRRHGRGGQQQRGQQPQPPAQEPATAEFEGDFTGEDENIDANEQTEIAVSNALSHPDSEPEAENGTAEPAVRRWRGRRGRRRRAGRGRAENASQQEQTEATSAPESSEEFEEEALPQETSVESHFQEPLAQADAVEENIPQREESPRQQRRPQQRERILLPGESLKKYGGGSAPSQAENKPVQTPAPTANVTALPRPATLVTDPSAFTLTGSGVLAGESLRKYRDRPGQQQQMEEANAEPQSIAEVEDHPVAPEVGAAEHSAEPVVAPQIAETEERAEQRIEAQAEPASVEEHRDAEPQAHENVEGQTHEAERTAGGYAFAPGAGQVEEELIDEEEQEFGQFGEALDETEYEDLEEETLDPDESREDEMIAAGEKIAAAFAEAKRSDQHSETEFEQEGDEDELAEGDEEGEEEDAEVFASEDVDPEHPEYEGRAEVRGPEATAGFQQRAERTPVRDRERGRRGGRRGRGGRPPMRSRRNIPRGPMPQINELLKEGQEILVQIAKEPMAKKGARITSHIALPGRFLVFMPTVNHTGVSRKIGSDEERRRLKQILLSEKGDAHGGFIVRTAAAGASEEELRSDIRFLINLWSEIKGRSEASKAPSLIYHDLNLVERILRDQVTSNFTSIWVDTEAEYERILRFAQRFQPSLIKRVKLYTKDTPLFEQFGVQDEINKALKSKVWLKSGGYIVINQTEALVAIDINTGKFVGKTGRLEDTIVKTNIDAIQEIVRQIGGIIIIDFIDMDERRNRQKVMQALEEALRADRSPTKVLQFNDFGLVAITRKRVKQSLERTLSTPCSYCTGTGMVKSFATVCNEIYVELRKMHKQLEGHQVMLRVNPEVAKALKENSGRWLTEMEELIGKTIIVKSDPAQHQEQFDVN
jgi:ribonuclease G